MFSMYSDLFSSVYRNNLETRSAEGCYPIDKNHVVREVFLSIEVIRFAVEFKRDLTLIDKHTEYC